MTLLCFIAYLTLRPRGGGEDTNAKWRRARVRAENTRGGVLDERRRRHYWAARPICYHLREGQGPPVQRPAAQRQPATLAAFGLFPSLDGQTPVPLLSAAAPPASSPPSAAPTTSSPHSSPGGRRRPRPRPPTPLQSPPASASSGCLSAAPARRSPLPACRLPCSSVIRAPPPAAASFRWTALKSQDLLSQRQRRRVMSEAAAASIGLSWAPKVPSLPTTRGSKDSGPNLSNAQESLWKPGTELVDGLFVPSRDPRKANKLARKNVKDTTGKGWFNMPAPSITPELKKDLEILQLRHVMDPKRHFKRAGKSKVLPKYFQVGTVIEPASEFFSSRLTKKERKTTLADELLSDQSLKNYRMRKVREIQETRTPGGNQKWKNKGKKTFKRPKDRRK